MKNLVFPWVFENIDFTNKIVCDIGVGPGFSCVEICKRNARQVYAVEPSIGIGGHEDVFQKLLRNIEINNLEDKVIPVRKDFLLNEFEDCFFDITIGINSLHHVIEESSGKENLRNIDKRLKQLFDEMERITKPGGQIIIWEYHSSTIWKYLPFRLKQVNWHLHPSLKQWLLSFGNGFNDYKIKYQHILKFPHTKLFFNNRLANYMLNPMFKIIINKEQT